MSYNLLLVLLYGQSQSMGEEVFVGAISALFFSIIMWLFNKRKQKKDIEETTKQVQQEIVKEVKENVCLASSIEIDYSFLYKDLLDKCNPSNYMNPYDAKKVEISNSIYSQIEENKNNTTELIKLRNRAIKELNIKFSSELLFEKLTQVFNPSNFMNENYDAVKLYAANKVYSQIQDFKDNIIELERIASENKIDLLSSYNQKIIDETPGKKDSNEDTGIIWFFFYIGLLIIILAVIIVCINTEKSNNNIINTKQTISNEIVDNGILSYSSDKLDITYPSTWEITSTEADKIVIKLKEKNTIDRITITVNKSTKKASKLAKITKKEIEDYNLLIDVDLILNGHLSDLKNEIIEYDVYEGSIGNYIGYKTYCYFKNPLTPTYVLDKCCIQKEDNTTVIITYISRLTNHNDLNKIIKSFTIR